MKHFTTFRFSQILSHSVRCLTPTILTTTILYLNFSVVTLFLFSRFYDKTVANPWCCSAKLLISAVTYANSTWLRNCFLGFKPIRLLIIKTLRLLLNPFRNLKGTSTSIIVASFVLSLQSNNLIYQSPLQTRTVLMALGYFRRRIFRLTHFPPYGNLAVRCFRHTKFSP